MTVIKSNIERGSLHGNVADELEKRHRTHRIGIAGAYFKSPLSYGCHIRYPTVITHYHIPLLIEHH